jgi:hypothetical protein
VYINYSATIAVYFYAPTISPTVTNVLASELADWREATYIDMQSSIASGISSVIQERPVEILPLQGGIVDFSYNRTRPEVTPPIVYTHQNKKSTNSQAGSHYIIYYKDVAVYADTGFMDTDGYVTRVLQMSQLESGAVEAAKLIAKIAKEQQEYHSLEIAPDVRIEVGDKVVISYTISGTGTVVSSSMVAESVSLNISEGSTQMSIGGRKYV